MGSGSSLGRQGGARVSHPFGSLEASGAVPVLVVVVDSAELSLTLPAGAQRSCCASPEFILFHGVRHTPKGWALP
jgi:hypothetical protein